MADPSPERAHRSAWLRPVAVVAGLLLLLWAVDAAVRVSAESLVASSIRSAARAAQQPEVHVRGALFLPQLIRGSYTEVDVTTTGITSGDLRIEQVNSHLLDVRVPFHDVLVGNVQRVAIAHSEERLRLTYADLNRYFEATERPLSLQGAPDGKVKLTGTLDVAGQQISANAVMNLSVSDGAVALTPEQIGTGANGSVDRPDGVGLGQQLTLTLPLADLPFGHRLTSVSASSDGIDVVAEGTGIFLEP